MPARTAEASHSLDAAAVAVLLCELGQRIELSGDSPFKARAYFRAAESLLALTEPLDGVIAAGRLRAIPGVGAAIDPVGRYAIRTGDDTVKTHWGRYGRGGRFFNFRGSMRARINQHGALRGGIKQAAGQRYAHSGQRRDRPRSSHNFRSAQ